MTTAKKSRRSSQSGDPIARWGMIHHRRREHFSYFACHLFVASAERDEAVARNVNGEIDSGGRGKMSSITRRHCVCPARNQLYGPVSSFLWL